MCRWKKIEMLFGPVATVFFFFVGCRHIIYVCVKFLCDSAKPVSFLRRLNTRTRCVDGGDGFLFHYYHYYTYAHRPWNLFAWANTFTKRFFFFTKRNTCARIRSLSPPARTYTTSTDAPLSSSLYYYYVLYYIIRHRLTLCDGNSRRRRWFALPQAVIIVRSRRILFETNRKKKEKK